MVYFPLSYLSFSISSPSLVLHVLYRIHIFIFPFNLYKKKTNNFAQNTGVHSNLFCFIIIIKNFSAFQTLCRPLPPPSRCPCRPGPTTPSASSPATRWGTPCPLATPSCASPPRMSPSRIRTMWRVAAPRPTTSSSTGRYVVVYFWKL